MKKLLLVIDYQNDFVSGSLGFEQAVSLEDPICRKIESYLKTDLRLSRARGIFKKPSLRVHRALRRGIQYLCNFQRGFGQGRFTGGRYCGRFPLYGKH